MESITDAFTALFALITKALPSDAERLARLKLNSPKIYQRIKIHMLKRAYNQLKKNRNMSVADFVAFTDADDTAEDQKEMTDLLTQELAAK